jgi:nucleoside-diphosphate-sugar epimerase
MPISISDPGNAIVMPAQAGIHDLSSVNLLIFGNGYSGAAIAQAARIAGIATAIVSRTPGLVPFHDAAGAIAAATHIIATAAPAEAQGDPVLAKYAGNIAAAPHLTYCGYLSTTGVYGNRDGAWVDEDSAPAPTSPRTMRRVAAEQAWRDVSSSRHLDIFRLAGIYGPGRSMFDDLRAGPTRRIIKPDHLFGRIHRDDIAHGVVTALTRAAPPGVTIFNFSDDEPAASADVLAHAASLLNLPLPPAIPFEEAMRSMSPMALSFWSENRRVGNDKTKAVLGGWHYPTYRAGLAQILAEERQDK